MCVGTTRRIFLEVMCVPEPHQSVRPLPRLEKYRAAIATSAWRRVAADEAGTNAIPEARRWQQRRNIAENVIKPGVRRRWIVIPTRAGYTRKNETWAAHAFHLHDPRNGVVDERYFAGFRHT